MLPIFKEYKQMLFENGVDLSEYDDDKLWIDRMIIKGFDKSGKEKKICRLKVVGDYDNLKYEVINYYKTKTKNNHDHAKSFYCTKTFKFFIFILFEYFFKSKFFIHFAEIILSKKYYHKN